jgi:hypothetical protein
VTAPQSGEPRVASDTQEHVLRCLFTALQPGVSGELADQARESGIKDAIAQPIIEQLVKLGQELRKAAASGAAAHTPDEIQAILTEELKKAHLKGGVMNPLLDMMGVYSLLLPVLQPPTPTADCQHRRCGHPPGYAHRDSSHCAPGCGQVFLDSDGLDSREEQEVRAVSDSPSFHHLGWPQHPQNTR